MLIKVAKDAVLPTVNAMNPELDLLVRKGITPGQLIDIFVRGTITRWNQVTGSESAKKIAVYTRSDLCGAGAVWAEFLGTNQGNLAGTGVYGDAGMTQAIKADAGSIGYDNLRYIFDNVSGNPYPKIVAVPIDFNSNRIIDPEEASLSSLESVKKSINSGTIPPPLSRDLYFIVNKKSCPPPALDFLYWTLTEGLSDIEASGYLSLPAEEYATQTLKLQEL
jgi:phosphate transport system substrate-binding protein